MNKQKLDQFYTWQAGIYDLTRRTILFDHDKAVDALHIQSTDTVLDVACGTGKNLPRLLKKLKPEHIRATDYSHALLDKARSKFPGVHFVHADVTKEQGDKQYDKIICSYSLSMIDEWKQALTVMKNQLKKEGKLVILDFHKDRKAGVLSKLVRGFLKRCHINLDQDVTGELKKHFTHVSCHRLHGGYNAIWIAHQEPIK